MKLPTPEERAVELVGAGNTATLVQIRRIVADAVQRDRAARLDAPGLDRAMKRIRKAYQGAEGEALRHHDHDRATYCDGQAAGLRAALRILDEELGR